MFFLTERFFLFLLLWLIAYWLSPERLRNIVLFLGAVGWLALFSPQTLVSISLVALVIVYPLALLSQRRRDRGDRRGAWVLAWTGILLLLLAVTGLRLKSYFLPALSLSLSPISSNILQWIGFSYFVLKSIHILLSAAGGIFRLPGPLTVLQYMLFLPTVTSGPIYRLDVFREQLQTVKRLGWDDVQAGLLRIVEGLGKKVVGVYFLNSIYLTLHARGSRFIPLSMISLYLLLFLDFSGYSDIAIGCGRLLGFRVPENFKAPFTATTMTQFWRNWHATFGDWIREHIFIPLGGMRSKGLRVAAVVLGTMLLVGLWHGYSLIFVAWGLYHGLLLVAEERLGMKPLRRHGTPWWRLGLRYAFVQAAAAGGVFAFFGLTGA